MNGTEYRKTMPDWKILVGRSSIDAVIEKSFDDGRADCFKDVVMWLENHGSGWSLTASSHLRGIFTNENRKENNEI